MKLKDAIAIDWSKSPYYRTRNIPVVDWNNITVMSKCPASIFTGKNLGADFTEDMDSCQGCPVLTWKDSKSRYNKWSANRWAPLRAFRKKINDPTYSPKILSEEFEKKREIDIEFEKFSEEFWSEWESTREEHSVQDFVKDLGVPDVVIPTIVKDDSFCWNGAAIQVGRECVEVPDIGYVDCDTMRYHDIFKIEFPLYCNTLKLPIFVHLYGGERLYYSADIEIRTRDELLEFLTHLFHNLTRLGFRLKYPETLWTDHKFGMKLDSDYNKWSENDCKSIEKSKDESLQKQYENYMDEINASLPEMWSYYDVFLDCVTLYPNPAGMFTGDKETDLGQAVQEYEQWIIEHIRRQILDKPKVLADTVDSLSRAEMKSQKKCFGSALHIVESMNERIRETEKIFYLNPNQQRELLDSIRELSSSLMQLGDCGDFTSELNGLGEFVFKAVRRKSAIPPSGIWGMWDEESQELLESMCVGIVSRIRRRLRILSKHLSKPARLPPTPDSILESLFPKYYAHLDMKISKNELKIVKDYDDSLIREKLTTILLCSEHISKAEKGELKQRKKTPHTGYEISDLWVTIESYDEPVRVDFVIKSGKEYTKSVPIVVWQQWIRPIEHKSNLSVLIAFARPSVVMDIRKDKYNSEKNCLRHICNEALALLFKSYGLLS